MMWSFSTLVRTTLRWNLARRSGLPHPSISTRISESQKFTSRFSCESASPLGPGQHHTRDSRHGRLGSCRTSPCPSTELANLWDLHLSHIADSEIEPTGDDPDAPFQCALNWKSVTLVMTEAGMGAHGCNLIPMARNIPLSRKRACVCESSTRLSTTSTFTSVNRWPPPQSSHNSSTGCLESKHPLLLFGIPGIVVLFFPRLSVFLGTSSVPWKKSIPPQSVSHWPPSP